VEIKEPLLKVMKNFLPIKYQTLEHFILRIKQAPISESNIKFNRMTSSGRGLFGSRENSGARNQTGQGYHQGSPSDPLLSIDISKIRPKNVP
jgi:hypothetical protein